MEISREFFLNTPGSFTSFLIDPWNFHSFCFFNTRGNSMSSTPTTYLDFFWNSPMSMDVTPKNCYGAMTDWLNTISCDKLGLGLNVMWSIENQEIKNISCLIQMLTMISQTVTIRGSGDVIDLIPWNAIILNFSSKLSYWITYIFPYFDQESPRKPTFTNFGTTGKVHTLHNKYVCMYLYVQGPRMMRIPINFLQSCQYYWLQIVIYLYNPIIISLCLERPSVIVVFLWFYKYP